MIKKLLNYLFILTLIVFSSLQVIAQTDVSAIWVPSSTALSINPATTSANISATTGLGATMKIFAFNQTTSGAVSDADNKWLRVAIPHPLAAANPSLPWSGVPEGNYDPTEYLEFTMKSDDGKWLQLTSINVPLIAFGSGDVRMVARYSVDGTAESDFKFFYKKANYWVQTSGSTGEVKEVALTPADRLTVRRNRNTVGTDGGQVTLDQITLKFTGLQINVAPGKTFRVRLYPFMRSEPSSTGSRGIQIRESISLTGKTSDAALATDEPLPLDFLSFTAKPSTLGAVNLDWKTTNEVNTKNFEVQSRTAHTEFKTIGTVRSKNTSGIHQYTFSDDKPAASTVYYRLKQIDNDGKFKYSDVVSANVKSSLSVKIYPNPVSSVLSVSHPSEVSRLTIVNLQGKKLIQQTIALSATSTEVNVSSLQAGTYIIMVEGKGIKSSLKFLKK